MGGAGRRAAGARDRRPVRPLAPAALVRAGPCRHERRVAGLAPAHWRNPHMNEPRRATAPRRGLRALVLGALLAVPALAWAQLDYNAYGVADLSWGRFEPSGSLKDNRFNSNSLSASFVGVNARDSLDGG